MKPLLFFFNDTATTEIYTLSLHDALPICYGNPLNVWRTVREYEDAGAAALHIEDQRSEEHTSELQSQSNLVCRLLLEKKKRNTNLNHYLTNVTSTLSHFPSCPARVSNNIV